MNCPNCNSKLYIAPLETGEASSCFECGHNPARSWSREPMAEELLDKEVVGEPIPADGQPDAEPFDVTGYSSDMSSLIIDAIISGSDTLKQAAKELSEKVTSND